MDDVLEVTLEVVNAGVALIILYLGFRITASMRLTLQRRSVNLFIIAAVLFAVQEVLAVIMATLPQLGTNDLIREFAETSFIICLATAMYLVTRSEKHEIMVLHRAADTDVMTQLPNMAFFRRTATQRLHQAKKDHAPLALLMLDVDDFKKYNDLFGHEAGNLALQAVAHTLGATVRSPDLAARYGGEEFAVLLATNCEGARTAAERLRSAVELKCAPQSNPTLSRRITVSIGIAVLTSTMKTVEEFIEAADQELYRAKTAGKNCVSSVVCR